MLQQFDERNRDLVIYVNGELLPRHAARISVFDSVVQGGDAVWEGIRVYDGKVFRLDRHLRRLRESAHALDFMGVPTVESIRDALFATLKANGMRDDTHVRLTLTRGEKITSGMDPRLNQSGCGLIVLAEWKAPVYSNTGIRLATAHIRRNAPDFLDSKIHHNNLLNNIMAKIQANLAGVDDAVMLDRHGMVAETNATNIFLVRDGALHTPTADACLPGITRATVLELAREEGIPAFESRLSLSEFYAAQEVFTTGTMGELTPVLEIDGRALPALSDPASETSVLRRLQRAFSSLTAQEGTALPDWSGG
jgi:branched-chain amino acid aminotransferase